MSNGNYKIKKPQNEPVKTYHHGSPEQSALLEKLSQMQASVIEIPLIIGGKPIYTGNKRPCIIPHNHQKVIGWYHTADETHVAMAIEAALSAKETWEQMSYQHRASIFLKAAELLATTWRDTMNAATMLCQSKNIHQAEIDAVCELIDFFRFNAYYLEQIYNDQALSTDDTWNRIEYTPLDGFVYAVSPFNFTSIGGNLACAPAMVGNVVVWKPASSAVYSNYYIMELLKEAGLPDGIINFLPGPAKDITSAVLDHPDFAGFHYTGSTEVFSSIWTAIGNRLQTYHAYPRIVGETGGKNFIFAANDCDTRALSTALIRGAFEFQGQKCSAASRAYIPESIWPTVHEQLTQQLSQLHMGTVDDTKNFINAVIDERAFDKITGYIDIALNSDKAEIIAGGQYDKSKGYFIQPTVILSKTIDFITMKEEIFGPVLTLYIYPDQAFDTTVKACANGSHYALTGAIFAKDRQLIANLEQAFKKAAGNLYINDKPTGAVVGQQPFGGSKASGTNDKAGSKLNLLRWINTRVVKENFTPPHHVEYPFMKKV